MDHELKRRAYRRAQLLVRAVLAVWIAFVIVLLCANGDWWGLIFIPFLALDLFLARRLARLAPPQ